MKSSLKVHRCRFVDYVPSAINCLAFSPSSSAAQLAMGRMDGTIEIWNPKDNWFCEKRLAGNKHQSVESLVWIHQTIQPDSDDEHEPDKAKKFHAPRLFSAGLNSLIVEWNLQSLQPQNIVDSNGGAIWCMAANHTQTTLAIGCEDGIIRLFQITENGLEYLNSLHKTDARILSIQWSNNDKFIFGACSDSCIRQWNVETARVQHRLAVDTVKGEDTLVWSVKLLTDNMLAAGTSLGSIHFFSTQTGTMIQSFKKAHHADVLCMAVNQAGDTLYSSGVDRRILQFKLVSTNSRKKWIPSGDRRWHSHDVRALALWDAKPIDALVSGGVDTLMVICSSLNFPNVAQRRISPFPPSIQVVHDRRFVVAKFNHSVALYRLGTASAMDVEPSIFGQTLEVAQKHAKVLQLNLQDDDNLTACAMSNNGEWIAVSTVKCVKLFSVEYNDEQISVRKAKEFPVVHGALALVFTPESSRLITAGSNARIYVHDLESMTTLKHFSTAYPSFAVTHLSVSSDGQWLAVGNVANYIEIYNLDGLTKHYSPPRLASPFTSFSFHPASPSTLIVTYTSNEFFLYDVEDKRMSDWSQEYGNKLPKRFVLNSEKIQGVGYNPARPNMLTFWGTGFITFVYLTMPATQHDEHLTLTKRKRTQLAHDYSKEEEDSEKKNFIKIHDYQPLMGLEYVSGDELVVVERPWFDILPHLPPSFYRPTYGT